MLLLEVERPTRKVIPDPIVAREVQEAFEQLAERTYRCIKAELLRACVLDSLKRHEQV